MNPTVSIEQSSQSVNPSSAMSSSAPPSTGRGSVQNFSGRRKPLGFMANAMKRKQSFIQFFAMTGILLLSVRSVGQKYRIHNLTEDTAALKEEHDGLVSRMNNIKQSLLATVALEPTGAFAARLRLLFGEESN